MKNNQQKMKLSVRELKPNDIENIVDYFINADTDFLRGMGADKSKLPDKKEWIEKLNLEFKKPYAQKELYYLIWSVDNLPIGHSNVNTIKFEEFATMHLHVWKNDKRNSGLGLKLLKLTIPYFFKNLGLKKLICEPRSENIAPNKTLKKLGFKLIRTYETIPGWINFKQMVNRYELTKTQFEIIKNVPQ